MDCDHVEDGKQNRMPNAAEVAKTTPENVTSEVVFFGCRKREREDDSMQLSNYMSVLNGLRADFFHFTVDQRASMST